MQFNNEIIRLGFSEDFINDFKAFLKNLPKNYVTSDQIKYMSFSEDFKEVLKQKFAGSIPEKINLTNPVLYMFIRKYLDYKMQENIKNGNQAKCNLIRDTKDIKHLINEGKLIVCAGSDYAINPTTIDNLMTLFLNEMLNSNQKKSNKFVFFNFDILTNSLMMEISSKDKELEKKILNHIKTYQNFNSYILKESFEDCNYKSSCKRVPNSRIYFNDNANNPDDLISTLRLLNKNMLLGGVIISSFQFMDFYLSAQDEKNSDDIDTEKIELELKIKKLFVQNLKRISTELNIPIIVVVKLPYSLYQKRFLDLSGDYYSSSTYVPYDLFHIVGHDTIKLYVDDIIFFHRDPILSKSEKNKLEIKYNNMVTLWKSCNDFNGYLINIVEC